MATIHGKAIPKEALDQLIADVKQKKELAGLYENFVETEVLKQLRHNKKALQTVLAGKTKSQAYKNIIKSVRAVLRRVYGAFQVQDAAIRGKLLQELSTTKKNSENYLLVHKKILATHASTKERLADYATIYKKIFAKTGKPKTIVDLGCGLNPISLPFMQLRAVQYIASDVNKDELAFIADYFEATGVDGKTLQLDLKKKNAASNIPQADVCFLFKVLDPLEQGKGHKLSEILIQAIPATWIVVSFATTTVAGKPMRHPYRGWIERMLNRISYSFSSFTTRNEIFYIIRKI